MHLTPLNSTSAPKPLSNSDPSPVAQQKAHENETESVSQKKRGQNMTESQTSALGRLAELAGVRTDRDEVKGDQSTASLLEDAVSRAETEQAARRDDNEDNRPRLSPSSTDVRSQAASPASSSQYYASSSPYLGTPMTMYGTTASTPSGVAGYMPSAYPGQPGFEPPAQQYAYYTAHNAGGYYQYQPVPYDQVMRRASPIGDVPPSSPLMHGESYYAVSPTMPTFFSAPSAQHGVYYYPSTEQQQPDNDLPVTETQHMYGAQPGYSPNHPMAFYGMPGYPPPSQFYAQQQQALYASQMADPRRYAVAPSSPTHMIPSPSNMYPAQPPPELARGHLAQARLHDAAYNRPPPAVRRAAGTNIAGGAPRSSMPKPPLHSDFALWVGNVPSDSNHAELWRFFTSRAGPGGQGASTGVESIHLISRSNCAFVNYSTQSHLDHALRACNGVSLRPGDPRTKELVCRIRRKEDDAKSGVGAQRGRGMHHHYVRDQEEEAAGEAVLPGAAPYTQTHSRHASLGEPPNSAFSRDSTAGQSMGSNSTSSTTSSFLTRYFKKRYFILKSHTEDDLRLSQEQSLWATQPHNEPILDQAYRTAHEGVFLIFSANKSGEFFGVAKMTGPIFSLPGNKSGSAGSSGLGPTIPEDKVLEHTDYVASPQPTSGVEKSHEFPLADAQKPRGASDPTPASRAMRSQTIETEAEQHGSAPAVTMPPSMAGALAQLTLGSSTSQPTEVDSDGIIRRDTALTAEERNARLEQIADEGEEAGLIAASKIQREMSQQTVQQASSGSWGPGWARPFKVEWIHTNRLSFARTKHLRNAFNGNREVRVARDGTEIEPGCGASLLAEFERTPLSPVLPQPASLPTSPRAAHPDL